MSEPTTNREISDGRPKVPAAKVFLGFTSVLWAWALYDLANTIFSALFVSLNFPVLVTELGGTERTIGLTSSVACLLSAVTVPFLGTISDQTGRRLPILLVMTVTCCIATPIVAFLPLPMAVVMAGLAYFAYYSGLSLYDALLPDLATKEQRGRASGLGVGVGYGGTILALAAAAPIYMLWGTDSLISIRAVNILVALLFLGFALPLFLKYHEKGSGERIEFGTAVRSSVARVVQGARLATKPLWFFIASSFFIVNAMMAIIQFFLLFARNELEIPMNQLLILYALLAVFAVIGSLISGPIVDKSGPRRVLFFAAFFWIAVLIYLMNDMTYRGFVIGGSAGGAAIGLVWTASRPLLCRLADPDRMGETFGFLGIANRASAVAGPAVFGFVAADYGYSAALASLIVFFAVGIVLLYFVPADPEAPSRAAPS